MERLRSANAIGSLLPATHASSLSAFVTGDLSAMGVVSSIGTACLDERYDASGQRIRLSRAKSRSESPLRSHGWGAPTRDNSRALTAPRAQRLQPRRISHAAMAGLGRSINQRCTNAAKAAGE